ncbi:MAG: cupin domain-containing protein [Miltoncostaeaceae bacterium]
MRGPSAIAAAALCAAAVSAPAVGIPTEGAERLDVSSGPAAGAPGLGLAMYKVTIPRNTTLPWHYHPGSQVAWIMRGRLHYSVVKGTAYETIPRPGKDPRRVPIAAGTRAVIEAGHGLCEPKGMQHYATTPEGQVITVVTVLKPPKMLGTIALGDPDDSPFPLAR